MKRFNIFAVVFAALLIIYSAVNPMLATAEDISKKVLRLHIIASTNSTEDQNIKLGLKDYFLDNSKDIFTASTIDESINIAKNNTAQIEKMCNEYLSQYNQSATVLVVNEYFPTRVYDDFTLPAGRYNTVKIEIGQARGHNWWCIVFPSVCLSSCSQTMQEYMTEDEMKLIEGGYSPKFKIIEIYEKIKTGLNE